MRKPMNVRLHQLNPTIGDIKKNTRQIISALNEAERAGVDLLLLPELCTTGYSPMDLLERPAFLQAIDQANKTIIEATENTTLIFGTVTLNPSQGRPCFNSAIVARKGDEIAEIHKTLLPTYDVYDDDRYFERNDSFECVEWNNRKLGITICEDIWANNSSVQYHTYGVSPVQELAEQGADAILNVSGSPFTVSKSEDRMKMLKGHANKTNLPIFYVNQVGGNTELISDGDSVVLTQDAEIAARAPLFETAFIDVVWNEDNGVHTKHSHFLSQVPSQTERIFKALQLGLKDYMEKSGVTSKVVLGLSGGIDSSLVACIAVEALGAENVMAIAMPSAFSSEGSVTDAEKLAENLGIELHQLPIQSLYDEYLNILEPLFKDTGFGVAEENLQSRARGMLLMAISNKFQRFVLNTGNKSELATGYCTLYGDMNGAVAVIADVYKTEVYELSKWLNESYYKKEMIPQSVLDKPPSAELKPNQKDSDHLPVYDKLDTILKLYLEKQYSLQQIVSRGFENKRVQQVIQLVDQNEYKRWQAPPVLKIHAKSFGTGRRWPLVHKWSKKLRAE